MLQTHRGSRKRPRGRRPPLPVSVAGAMAGADRRVEVIEPPPFLTVEAVACRVEFIQARVPVELMAKALSIPNEGSTRPTSGLEHARCGRRRRLPPSRSRPLVRARPPTQKASSQ